jgi:hypothetical protein
VKNEKLREGSSKRRESKGRRKGERKMRESKGGRKRGGRESLQAVFSDQLMKN